MSDLKPQLTIETCMAGPTCATGSFKLFLYGPLTSRTVDAAIKQLSLYRDFLMEDEANAAGLQKPESE